MAYDPFTQSVDVIDNLDKLKIFSKNLETQISKFNGALARLNMAKK